MLLAEDELRNEPVHVTVVGAKDDPRSAALYRAALAYPLAYKRAEWWDKREGKLANPDVDYPDYPDGPGGLCLHPQFLFAAGDRCRGDPGAARPAAALFARVGALHFPPHSYGEVSRRHFRTSCESAVPRRRGHEQLD